MSAAGRRVLLRITAVAALLVTGLAGCTFGAPAGSAVNPVTTTPITVAPSPPSGDPSSRPPSSGGPAPSVSASGTPVTTVLPVGTGSSTVVQAQPAAGSCHARGAGPYSEPDLRCTPGALNPAVTQADLSATICRSGYSASIRPSEDITEPEKLASMRAYGDTDSPSDYEYDHDVSLELGGAPNDARNLWPEPQGSPNPKDKLEDRLHELVCNGTRALARAQQQIATDWIGAYAQYVGPVPAGSYRPGNATISGATPTPASHSTLAPAGGAQPHTPSPAGSAAFTSVPNPIAAGSTDTITANSDAGTACTLTVTLPSGRVSAAAGLGPQTAAASGDMSWTWHISSTTKTGSALAQVSCGGSPASRSFTIT